MSNEKRSTRQSNTEPEVTMKRVGFEMPQTIYEELRKRARQEGLPITGVVRLLIKRYLNGDIDI